MNLLVATVLKACRHTNLMIVSGDSWRRRKSLLRWFREHWFDDSCGQETDLWWILYKDKWCTTTTEKIGHVTKIGPARAVFVEPRESGVSAVIWIVHGGTLLRAAFEHLRLGTRSESEVTGAVNSMVQLPLSSNKTTPGQHVDLGSMSELQELERLETFWKNTS